MQQDGIRRLQPLPDAPRWFACFNMVQMNEDEMRQLSPDPLSLSAAALGAGVSLLTVTLGPRGAAYVAAPLDGSAAARTALVAAPIVEVLDPTGCGDVFGATLFARLLAGDSLDDAMTRANIMGAKTAGYRGATGLNRYLRGELVSR
jgi:sugar/nucleoside kinase (ribokinase family)